MGTRLYIEYVAKLALVGSIRTAESMEKDVSIKLEERGCPVAAKWGKWAWAI